MSSSTKTLLVTVTILMLHVNFTLAKGLNLPRQGTDPVLKQKQDPERFIRKIRKVKRKFLGRIKSTSNGDVFARIFKNKQSPKLGTVIYAISKNNDAILAILSVKRLGKKPGGIYLGVKELAEGLKLNSLVSLKLSNHRIKANRKGSYFIKPSGTKKPYGKVKRVHRGEIIVRITEKSDSAQPGDKFYILTKNKSSIAAEIECSKQTKNPRFFKAKIIDLSPDIMAKFLKNLHVVESSKITDYVGLDTLQNKQNQRSSDSNLNPIIKILGGVSQLRHVSIDLVNNSQFNQEINSQNWTGEFFLPISQSFSWSNWIGVSYNVSNYNQFELTFKNKESQTDQNQILSGGRNRIGLLFKPLFSSAIVNNFHVDYAIKQEIKEEILEKGDLAEEQSMIKVVGSSLKAGVNINIYSYFNLEFTYSKGFNQRYSFQNTTLTKEGDWNRSKIGMNIQYYQPFFIGGSKLSFEGVLNYDQIYDTIEPLNLEKKEDDLVSPHMSIMLGLGLISF